MTVELSLDSGIKTIQRTFRSLVAGEEWVVEMSKNSRFIWGGNELFAIATL